MEYQTRIEYTNGIPYVVRIHRNADARKERAKNKPVSLQQEMMQHALGTIQAIRHDNFKAEEYYSNIGGSTGLVNDFLIWTGIKTNPPADTSATGPGPSVDPYPAPGTYWTANEWMEWFNNVVAVKGQPYAISQFAQFWAQRDPGGAEGKWGSDPTFVAFCKANGLDSIPDIAGLINKTDLGDKIIATTKTAAEHAAAAANNLAAAADHGTDDVDKAVKKGGQVIDSTGAFIKWVPWIFGGVVLVTVAVIAYILITEKTTIIKTAGSAAKFV